MIDIKSVRDEQAYYKEPPSVAASLFSQNTSKKQPNHCTKQYCPPSWRQGQPGTSAWPLGASAEDGQDSRGLHGVLQDGQATDLESKNLPRIVSLWYSPDAPCLLKKAVLWTARHEWFYPPNLCLTHYPQNRDTPRALSRFHKATPTQPFKAALFRDWNSLREYECVYKQSENFHCDHRRSTGFIWCLFRFGSM